MSLTVGRRALFRCRVGFHELRRGARLLTSTHGAAVHMRVSRVLSSTRTVGSACHWEGARAKTFGFELLHVRGGLGQRSYSSGGAVAALKDLQKNVAALVAQRDWEGAKVAAK